MVQYFSPFPGSKASRVFTKREEALRRAIQHAVPVSKLTAVAEDLRVAKLRLLKAQRNRVESCTAGPTRKLETIDAEIERWTAVSLEQIIQKYEAEKPNQSMDDDS